MHVRFWGVRGSVPWTIPLAIGHGCNTPCVELIDEASGDRLVLDAGSGIVGLSEALGADAPPVPILLSHCHWDHIQGLPFFAPLYVAGRAPTLWAPSIATSDAAWAAKVFEAPFFPVPFDRLPSAPAVRPIGLGRTHIGPFDVTTCRLNHPGGALAYRIAGARGDLVYASDHEMGNESIDRALCDFMAGASAVIFDAHFTPDEKAAHDGWGHSTWTDATQFCASAGVQRLWLFHHKPGRTDTELCEIEAGARAIVAEATAAAEGDTFDV